MLGLLPGFFSSSNLFERFFSGFGCFTRSFRFCFCLTCPYASLSLSFCLVFRLNLL